jgi:hypothetical protein
MAATSRQRSSAGLGHLSSRVIFGSAGTGHTEQKTADRLLTPTLASPDPLMPRTATAVAWVITAPASASTHTAAAQAPRRRTRQRRMRTRDGPQQCRSRPGHARQERRTLSAARAALSGRADGAPPGWDGQVETIRAPNLPRQDLPGLMGHGFARLPFVCVNRKLSRPMT